MYTCTDCGKLCLYSPPTRLIAAAPELLEALKIAMHYIEGDSDDEQECMDYATIQKAIATLHP